MSSECVWVNFFKDLFDLFGAALELGDAVLHLEVLNDLPETLLVLLTVVEGH